MKYSASFKLQVVKFASVKAMMKKNSMAFEEKQTNKQTNGSFRSHQI